MVKALTVRVVLSVVLFALLMLGFHFGFITGKLCSRARKLHNARAKKTPHARCGARSLLTGIPPCCSSGLVLVVLRFLLFAAYSQ